MGPVPEAVSIDLRGMGGLATVDSESDTVSDPKSLAKEALPMSELVKLTSGELTAERDDLRTLVASLAQQLQTVTVKHADDCVCEVEFSSDNLGSRGRLRFRSYRRPPNAA
jgi:hypothetical protein